MSTLKKSGFTLIELVISILVMAMLTAIILPVFNSSRERSRQSACIGHLKGIALAVRIYSLDNDGRVPCFKEVHGGNAETWARILLDGKYADSPSLFFCPSDSFARPDGSKIVKSVDELEAISYNYSINAEDYPDMRPADDKPFAGNYRVELGGGAAGIEPLPFCGTFGLTAFPGRKALYTSGVAPYNDEPYYLNAGGNHGRIFLALYRNGSIAGYRRNDSGELQSLGR